MCFQGAPTVCSHNARSSCSLVAACTELYVSATPSRETVHRTVSFSLAFEPLLARHHRNNETGAPSVCLINARSLCSLVAWLFIAIRSATLSLKTLPRSVFTSLRSAQSLQVPDGAYTKKDTTLAVVPFLVHHQGLELRTNRL